MRIAQRVTALGRDLSGWLYAVKVALDPGHHDWDDDFAFGAEDFAVARSIIDRASKTPIAF